MMHIFKHPKRSAHGFYSTKSNANPSKASSRQANMDMAGETPAHLPVDSVITPNAHGNGEPLVLDFATMHDAHSSKGPDTSQIPLSVRPTPERQSSWLSDDDIAAPPPPDFTRRDIHVPSRTR